MKLGFSLPAVGGWATPDNQVRLAREAEAMGYNSLWAPQRLLYPLHPLNDYPPLPGEPWPRSFECVNDPIVSMAYVAAATTRIRLGISVVVMPFFTPILLAKQLATLDLVSGGRLDVGLGIGWSRDEYEAVGVPYRDRGRRADEFIRCLKAIWTDEIVEFHGSFYTVPRSLVEPKPIQKPHPPILIGGYGPAAVKRAIALGDGFAGGNTPFAQVEPLLSELRIAAEAAGRDTAQLRVVCRGAYQLYAEAQGSTRRPLFGSIDEIREDVERYAAAGLTELFFEANGSQGGSREQPDPGELDRTLAFMEAFAPGGAENFE